MRSLALVAALVPALALVACASRADFPERPRRAVVEATTTPTPGVDPKTVAAEVVGKKLTVGDIDAGIAEQLASARQTYEMSLYEARKAALARRIQQELMQTEASQRGMTVEALIKAEVDGKITPPTDSEQRALYEQFKDQMDGASYEVMADRLKEHLSQERSGNRLRDYLAELRKRHGVKVLLDPPRVTVEAKGPTRGPADAKVTILIYSDFECPFCGRAEPTLAKVRETYPNDVKFVFRHYPLPFHASARPAAAASACAAEQGKFWEVHDQLFGTGELGVDSVRTFLGKIAGFDLAKYDACLSSGRGEAVVATDVTSAGLVGVDSTPHFFVNGVRISGAQPFEAFQSIINAELDR